MVTIVSCSPVCDDIEPVALPGNNMPPPPTPVGGDGGIPDFDAGQSYDYPQVVYYNGIIYRANGPVAPGPFDPADWTALDSSAGGQAIVTEDSDSIDFSGDGTALDPLTGEVYSAYVPTNYFPLGTSLAEHLQAIDEALPFSADGRTVVHEIVLSRPGPVLTDQLVLEYLVTKDISIPLGLAGSLFKLRGTAGQSVTLNLFKNTTPIGAVTIDTTSASVTFLAQVDFVAGDYLDVIAAGDAAFSNVAMTIQALRQLDFVA
jgi:hypothetical protein